MLGRRVFWITLLGIQVLLCVKSDENVKKSFLFTGPKQLLPGTEERFCLYLQGIQSAGVVRLQFFNTETNLTFGAPDSERRIDPEIDYYGTCIPLRLQVPPLDSFTNLLSLKVDWNDNTTDLVIDVTKEVDIGPYHPWPQPTQTDKGTYAPGERVRFRTLTLNHLLKPVTRPVKRIWCTDPDNNVAQEWLNVKTSIGVVELEFQLPENATEGKWDIYVENLLQNRAAEFVVTKDGYSMIEANTFEDFTSSDPLIDLFLACAESFKLGLPYYGQGQLVDRDRNKALVNQTVLLCVREAFYDLNETGSNPLAYAETDQCVNVTTDNNGAFVYSYLPRNPETVQLKISAVYQSPEKDDEFGAFMGVQRGSAYSPSGSFASISFTGSERLHCNARLSLKVYFNNVEPGQNITLHYIATSRGDILTQGTLQAEVITDFVELPGVVEGIESPVKLAMVDLEIQLTPSYYPKGQLMVFYVREGGEVVTADTSFSVGECFPNPVSLHWNETSVQPGQSIALSLESTPGSLCGVAVVDKNVSTSQTEWKLMEQITLGQTEAYTINSFSFPRQSTLDKIHCERQSGTTTTTTTTTTENPDIPLSELKPFSGGDTVYTSFSSFYIDAISSFDQAGLLVISNLDMELRPCYSYSWSQSSYPPNAPRTYGKGGRGRLGAKRPVRSVKNDGATDVPLPHSVADNWLWGLYTAESDGNVKVDASVPSTPNSWVARAFCVSKITGFGMSNEAVLDLNKSE